MDPRGLVARALRTVLRAVEGAYRPGPYYLPVTGGWLPAGTSTNFWQQGYDPVGGPARSAMVEACISAYAQTVAMCPGDHWHRTSKGGRKRIVTSALSRILRRPNAYQSISDFLLNATRNLFLDGNAYALALRNDRYEISELHLMDSRASMPQVAPTGDIFYQLAGNDVISEQIPGTLVVPQRDVLHVRLHNGRRSPYPLLGESPLMATLQDIGVSDAIANQQLQFYINQARPSAVLSTDLKLDKNLVQELSDRWDEKSRGLHQGKTPILTHGLKVLSWAVSGKDAEIAEILKISEQRIALAFRVPLQLLGLGGGPSYGSAETLMQFWIATGLGFALNHIEEALGLLFRLRGQPEEYVELDTNALLRSATKDRIDALARGVQGGIYSPNEARNQEGLNDVPYGDEPRVQAQVVPLSTAGKIPPAPSATSPPTPPALESPAQPTAPPPPKDYSDDIKRETRRLIDAAARVRRRFS